MLRLFNELSEPPCWPEMKDHWKVVVELPPVIDGLMEIVDPGAILKLLPRLTEGLGKTITLTEELKVQPLEVI